MLCTGQETMQDMFWWGQLDRPPSSSSVEQWGHLGLVGYHGCGVSLVDPDLLIYEYVLGW